MIVQFHHCARMVALYVDADKIDVQSKVYNTL